jgi:hypothetical protein
VALCKDDLTSIFTQKRKTVTMSEETIKTEEPNTAAEENQTIQGRSIFIIETVAAGVAVQTALLTEDNNVHSMPAVFPSLQYALQQIDELRGHIINHFENAAQVGAKIIADNAAAQASEKDNADADTD